MAAWDDAMKALGDDGKDLAAQFKDLVKQVEDDMSSFLQTETDRVKGFLTQFNNGDFDGDVLATLLRGEKRYLRAHIDMLGAVKEAQAEKDISNTLFDVLGKLIKLL